MLDEIERELTAAVEAIESNSNSKWTRAVKSALERIAKKHRLDCRFSDRSAGHPANWEFLCDVLWLETESGSDRHKDGYFQNGHRIRRCILACEIEWSGAEDVSDRIYDFSKLLLMKAEYLLFVGEAVNQATKTRLLSEMKAAIEACQTPPRPKSVLVGIHTHGEGPAIKFCRL